MIIAINILQTITIILFGDKVVAIIFAITKLLSISTNIINYINTIVINELILTQSNIVATLVCA